MPNYWLTVYFLMSFMLSNNLRYKVNMYWSLTRNWLKKYKECVLNFTLFSTAIEGNVLTPEHISDGLSDVWALILEIDARIVICIDIYNLTWQ